MTTTFSKINVETSVYQIIHAVEAKFGREISGSILSILDNLDDVLTERSLILLSSDIVDKYVEDVLWSNVAAQIYIKFFVKSHIKPTFSENIKQAGKAIKPMYQKFISDNASQLDKMIDESLDLNVTWLSIGIMCKTYLLSDKIGDEIIPREIPQYLWLRVAIQSAYPNLKKIKKRYLRYAKCEYTQASPSIFNACLLKNGLTSCFLSVISDNIESIADFYSQIALVSARGGGLGYSMGDIRHSKITNAGESKGIVKLAQTHAQIFEYIVQGGKRKGSGTPYLPCWHVDVEKFIALPTQGPAEQRIHTGMTFGLWVSDLFFERVQKDENWSLFCPNEARGLTEVFGDEFKTTYEYYERQGKASKVIKARDLQRQILLTWIEKGFPYVMAKDAINRKTNQSALGTVKCSNLCVSGDTKILTRTDGYIPIENACGRKVEIWNGREWSSLTPFKTSEDAKLRKISFSNGCSIKCTPDHTFYIQKTYSKCSVEKVEARKLSVGDKLEKWELPDVDDFSVEKDEEYFPHPYTHGFFTGDGTVSKRGVKYIWLYTINPEKCKLLEELKYVSYTTGCNDKLAVRLVDEILPKFEVPVKCSKEVKLLWFAGYCDADGTISRNGTNESLQIACIEKKFLQNVLLMLHTLGIEGKITKSRDVCRQLMPDGRGGQKEYDCKKLYRLLITSTQLQKLMILGFAPKRLKVETQNSSERCKTFCQSHIYKNYRKWVDVLCN